MTNVQHIGAFAPPPDGNSEMMRPYSGKRSGLDRDEAEQLAIQALTFLAAEEARLAQFIAATGYGLAAIRAEAGSLQFLAAVLDFLMEDESLLLVFAAHSGCDPRNIGAAREVLRPGSVGIG
jgi:Protein of unknown function (DUF3572)